MIEVILIIIQIVLLTAWGLYPDFPTWVLMLPVAGYALGWAVVGILVVSALKRAEAVVLPW